MNTTKLRFVAVLVALTMVSAACGARLNDAQRTAVRAGQATAVRGATDDGGGGGTDGSTDTTLALGGDTGTGSSSGGTTHTTTAGGGTQGATVNVHAMPAGGNGGKGRLPDRSRTKLAIP